jgi:hypothetical protein
MSLRAHRRLPPAARWEDRRNVGLTPPRRRFSRLVWAEACGLVTLSKLERGLLAQTLCLAHGKAEYRELAWVVRFEIFGF